MADIEQRRDEGFPEQTLADVPGIDRDHVVAALREIFEGEVTRSHVDRRRPDHRDRLHAVEDLSDVIVGVGVMVHCELSITSLREAKRRSNPVFLCGCGLLRFPPNDGNLALSDLATSARASR